MVAAIMMVGLPGTGKTTVGDKYLSKFNDELVLYLSTDDIIGTTAAEQNKTYDEVFQDTINKATKEVNSLRQVASQQNVNVIVDQTNLSIKKRQEFLKQFDHFDMKICVFIQPPTDLNDIKKWQERLDNRPGKTIPSYIMTSMIANLQAPTLEEGWDSIHVYDMFGEVKDRKYKDDKK